MSDVFDYTAWGFTNYQEEQNIDLEDNEVILYSGMAISSSRNYLAIKRDSNIFIYRQFDDNKSWFLEGALELNTDDWLRVLNQHVYKGGDGLNYLPKAESRPEYRWPLKHIAEGKRPLKTKQEVRGMWEAMGRIKSLTRRFEKEKIADALSSGDILNAIDYINRVFDKFTNDIVKKFKSKEICYLSVRVMGPLDDLIRSLDIMSEFSHDLIGWRLLFEGALMSLRNVSGDLERDFEKFALSAGSAKSVDDADY